jgi:hypothetical protein
MLSLLDSVHTLTMCCLKICLMLSSHLCPGRPSFTSLQVLLLKQCMHFSCTTHSAHLNVLNLLTPLLFEVGHGSQTSKAWTVFGRSEAVIADSNPALVMDV